MRRSLGVVVCALVVLGCDDEITPPAFDAARRDAGPPPDAALPEIRPVPAAPVLCVEGEPCRCEGGMSCELDCPGGGCKMVCADESICVMDCSGGGCELDCMRGSMCDNHCTGGDCGFDCDHDATCVT